MYPPLNPILVQLGPLTLHWYGIIMTLAIFLGALTASRYVTRHGGDGSIVWDMLLWVLIPAIIGARLYYVFIQSPRGPDGLDRYLSHPIEILQIWRGGIHIYGAIIFGAIALILYIRQRKLSLPLYLDGVVLGLALGQTIGRLGNFINQELYGPPTTLPWGLRIDQVHRIAPYDNSFLYPDSIRFQPLFLYEMLWDGIGFLLLLWISQRFARRLRTGDLFLLYLIWVPTGRFFIEFMRTDSWFFPGTPFNVVHIIIALAVIGAALAFIMRQRSQLVTSAGSTALIDSTLPLETETVSLATENTIVGESDPLPKDIEPAEVVSLLQGTLPEEPGPVLEEPVFEESNSLPEKVVLADSHPLAETLSIDETSTQTEEKVPGDTITKGLPTKSLPTNSLEIEK